MDIKVKIEVPGLPDAIHALAQALSGTQVSTIKEPAVRATKVEPGSTVTAEKIGPLPDKAPTSTKSEKADAEPEKTEPAKVDTSQEIDIKVVREKLAAKTQEGKQAEIKKLFAKFGVKKLSEVPKEKYAELLELAEEL
ncbi:hypothetical protein [Bacillus sp. FSL K6-1284]|uniref:hypothetical protein n=1 Tax=Bacillus sp. FSL K6-1284 TaxID=2921468 RepID=UPI0030F558B1